MRLRRLVASATLLGSLAPVLAPLPATAQVLPGKASATAPAVRGFAVVDAVEIVVDGIQSVSKEAVKSSLEISPGVKLEPGVLERSTDALERSGFYDRISIDFKETSPGKAVVTVTVQPKYRVGRITFANTPISEDTLREQIKTRSAGFLDDRTVANDERVVKEYFVKKGYADFKISSKVERDPSRGTADLTFTVEAGAKVRISSISFVGNNSLPEKKLRGVMETKKWNWLISWLTGRGRFDENKFADDLDKLRQFYQDNGFLDVQIAESDVKVNRITPKKMTLTINIVEGRQYKTGNIQFSGNTLFKSEELDAVLKLRPGTVFSPSKLEDDVQRIKDHYGALGYLETRVDAQRVPETSTGAMGVRYVVKEGDKYKLQSIVLEGNTKTKSIVVLRELALFPGETFNTVKMRTSQNRLKNMRFFDDVQLTPESTNIPGEKNMRISLKEGRTGNLQFGVGFSTLESAIFFVEISQGNFDLFNPGKYFQGDGQKARLRLQLGTKSNEVTISFEEPWLFERRLALGFEIFRSQSDYFSDVYSELRQGFEVYLRKRLVGIWEGRLYYRLEQVSIDDVDVVNAPAVIVAGAGDYLISKVGISLIHDTRNELYFTSDGHRVSLTTEYYGVGGDVDMVKLEGRVAQYVPMDEEKTHVVAFLGRIGTLFEQGSKPTPFFERYYLGGPNTLRGFDFREVGPKDALKHEPVGGLSYLMGSVEYSYRVAEPLQLAVFYDVGVVNAGQSSFSTSAYNDNWGVGVRVLILGAPLRLDYGIPITTDAFNDKGGRFNFSFGTRF